MTEPQDSEPIADLPPEAVWTFRGYQMRPAEFNTAMVHFYRGEIQRATTWRTRLDTTTNWAVAVTGATILFALAYPTNYYGVIILNTLLVTLFLLIEARRYRYYELWANRVRLMETDFFSAMLVPPFAPSPDWAESLAESLLKPDFPITMWEAFGRRFRRNYMWIYVILAGAWVMATFMFPVPAMSLQEVLNRSAIGPLPGWAVLLAGVIYNGLIFGIGFSTAGLRAASGEVHPKWGDIPVLNFFWRASQTADSSTANVGNAAGRAWQRPTRKRQQLLAMIISGKSKPIADRIMKEMRRGVTALHGRGMYAQQERDVLMVALTVTEMSQIKALVKEEDPNAFMVVSPAHDVLGRGFQSFEG